MNLHEVVIELRKEYCKGCRDQFTDEEIENGKQCAICDKVQETGETVATLRD